MDQLRFAVRVHCHNGRSVLQVVLVPVTEKPEEARLWAADIAVRAYSADHIPACLVSIRPAVPHLVSSPACA
jgi:hypothetical protein